MTEEQQLPESALVVTFAGVGSSEFGFQFMGQVTPNQLLCLSEYFNAIAKSMILEMRNQALVEAQRKEMEQPKIKVPKPDFKIRDETLRT